ncbi:hypothetical protein NQ314_017962 [Rhamnusium bicolor]|uniref:Ribosomal protein S7 n=1 Tax=Rhamnusium bicolor TaxID=1586634 RepID=A0AAV8WSI0_9CUCU|nr:hypothetical protein NQ314_017962 [Rhamnusium bicolor]
MRGIRSVATGRSYKDHEFSTIISKQALSRIIVKTCEAIYKVLKKAFLKVSECTHIYKIIYNITKLLQTKT